MRSRDTWVAFFVGCVLAFAVWTLYHTTQANKTNQRTTCQQVQALAGAIETTLIRDLRTIGQVGSAGYVYYKAHPNELANARSLIRQQIVTFAPRRCK